MAPPAVGAAAQGRSPDLTRIHELAQLEHLGLLLAERSAATLVLSGLANEVQVSVDTVRRWVDALSALH